MKKAAFNEITTKQSQKQRTCEESEHCTTDMSSKCNGIHAKKPDSSDEILSFVVSKEACGADERGN